MKFYNNLITHDFNIHDFSISAMLENTVARIFSIAIFILILFACLTSNVFAAAGDSISNTATISYDIAGISGSANASTTFTEDRRVNFIVSESNGGAAVPVISDMTNAVMQFSVSNTGNDTFDFLITAVNTVQNPFGLPVDSFDPLPGTIQLFVENGGMAGYQASQDTAVYVDELLPNTARTIYVLADMPTVMTDVVAAIALIAQVAEGGAAGVEGVAINADDNGRTSPAGDYSNGSTSVLAGSPSNTPDTLAMETVFNDPAGASAEDLSSDLNQDSAGNGQHSDAGAYQVGQPVMIIKSVTVIDTLGGTDPHPGAVLRYQLDVVVGGNVAVDNLVISDVIPANTSYVDESILLNGVAQTDEDNLLVDYSKANTFPVKPITSIEVDLSQNGSVSVSPGTTNTIIFDVTID